MSQPPPRNPAHCSLPQQPKPGIRHSRTALGIRAFWPVEGPPETSCAFVSRPRLAIPTVEVTSRSCSYPHAEQVQRRTERPSNPLGPVSAPHLEHFFVVFVSLTTSNFFGTVLRRTRLLNICRNAPRAWSRSVWFRPRSAACPRFRWLPASFGYRVSKSANIPRFRPAGDLVLFGISVSQEWIR
jgi:hypothetical protein